MENNEYRNDLCWPAMHDFLATGNLEYYKLYKALDMPQSEFDKVFPQENTQDEGPTQ